MKIKTATLTDTALDLAVALSAGLPCKIEIRIEDQKKYCYLLSDAGYRTGVFKPSTDPSQSWPIIERESINLYLSTGKPSAAMWENLPGGGRLIAEATDCPTGLIAAMRCYVASRLGDEVEIPETLLGE